MGESILIKRKSSITNNSFAAIAVSYPSGSTCTCTCGSTVITAPNTTGLVVFKIPSSGTWQIKSTNGTQTVIKNIDIPTNIEQFHTSITLEYNFTLFSSTSALPSSYSWGRYTQYSYNQNTSYDSSGNKVKIAESNTQREIVYFTPAIDCSKYSKITFTGKQTGAGSTASVIHLGITSAIPANGSNTPTYVANTTFDANKFNAEHSVTLDISSVNTSCYVVISGFYMSPGEITSIVFS